MWTQRQSHSHSERPYDHRNPFERDLTRIIHSPAFRRMQGKTQIHGSHRGDFHRTRLTHSLEVASIARGIVRNIQKKIPDSLIIAHLPAEDLITAIALLHDIGHPPFGHGGETALNTVMLPYGGFESNAQTLHLVTQTETSYGTFGLDLTRRTLLGILKYPAALTQLTPPATTPDGLHIPAKGYYEEERDTVAWILAPFCAADRAVFQSVSHTPDAQQVRKTRYKSLDCSIMDLADDIAYGIHDLEDALYLNLVDRAACDTPELRHILSETIGTPNQLLDKLFASDHQKTKSAIGDLVHYCITHTHIGSRSDHFYHAYLQHYACLPAEGTMLLHYLKTFVFDNIIRAPDARRIERENQTLLTNLFHAISQSPRQHLDAAHQARYEQANQQHDKLRVVCDFIANMSDTGASMMHQKICT